MGTQIWIYFFVILTFGIYVGIAIWARAGSTKDFYVAGGGVGPVANGAAVAADWMSAASFISMAGLIAFMGYGGSLFLMGWTGGYCLLAMLLAPYLRKFGRYTVPDFFKTRYYSKTASGVAVLCLLIASLTYVIGQMTGVGVAFSRFLEVSNTLGVIIGMAVVFVYAVLGGMKGITYTQIAQYTVMIIAYTIPAIFISITLTGNPLPQFGLGSEFGDTGSYMLQKLNEVVTSLGFSEYSTNFRFSKLNMFVYTLSLMIGTAGLPHVIMRFFTVASVKNARLSAGWALIFIAILYTTAPAVAAMARLNIHATVNKAVMKENGNYFAPENSIKYENRPEWMRNWEVTGLIQFKDKNNDGRIQYYNGNSNDQQFLNNAAAAGWEGNELTVNRDIMVLANPEIANLPGWVIGLVAAGGLAAALSTAAGLLLAISSAISHDLVKGMIKPDISEKGELLTGRIAMAASIIFAGYLGLNPPDFAAGTVAIAFGLAASSLFPAIMMGIFSKTMNKEGAIAGMIAGIGVTMIYVFAHKGIFFIPGTEFLGLFGGNARFFLGIEPNAFGTIGAIVNFLVAFGVKNMTQKVPDDIAEMVENIRYPKGAGEVTSSHH
ncbi:putative sodium symporter protein [Flexistipes sinusarabici DSM 4947]|uniref:Sodium symporter protein n=4 Tax=Flexistipes sinusarabici TaxID=2352 RepID=F8E7G6_FLESM|nr:sodium:solute symporter family protein [Flexistipes sinusarabici]AEI14953.1 putative sodium symporter protein [Flexistipes sinusarabici DSM 4947]